MTGKPELQATALGRISLPKSLPFSAFQRCSELLRQSELLGFPGIGRALAHLGPFLGTVASLAELTPAICVTLKALVLNDDRHTVASIFILTSALPVTFKML